MTKKRPIPSDSRAPSAKRVATESSECFHDLCQCPITLDWMRTPVLMPCGHTFDHDAITRWLLNDQNQRCPTCRAHWTDPKPIPNLLIRDLISHLAPKGTLLETKKKKTNGKMLVKVSFQHSEFGLIIKPSTSFSRMLKACRERFGQEIFLTLHGRKLTNVTTAASLGLEDGSTLIAITEN